MRNMLTPKFLHTLIMLIYTAKCTKFLGILLKNSVHVRKIHVSADFILNVYSLCTKYIQQTKQ